MTTALVFFLLLFVLQIADTWTTWRVLSLGGHEENPPLAWLMKRLGVVPALVVVKLVAMAPLAMLVKVSSSAPLVQFILALSIGLYTWVVVHNKQQLAKIKRRRTIQTS